MARSSKNAPLSLEALLAPCAVTSPATWPQGLVFRCLSSQIGQDFSPESTAIPLDTAALYGSRWIYQAMVAEEDWMGQQRLQLRFLAPSGVCYRFNTGPPFSAVSDTSYIPALATLYPEPVVQAVDQRLRAQRFYLLCNDERVTYMADTVTHPLKYVEITVDSVTIGKEVAPLRVCFSSHNGTGYFYTSLPHSRQETTSTPITRFLSTTDPFLVHPNITPEVWRLIQSSQIRLDMTTEEVRLALGRPSRTERFPSRNGMIEYWFYQNNQVCQFENGRLAKIGLL